MPESMTFFAVIFFHFDYFPFISMLKMRNYDFRTCSIMALYHDLWWLDNTESSLTIQYDVKYDIKTLGIVYPEDTRT